MRKGKVVDEGEKVILLCAKFYSTRIRMVFKKMMLNDAFSFELARSTRLVARWASIQLQQITLLKFG